MENEQSTPQESFILKGPQHGFFMKKTLNTPHTMMEYVKDKNRRPIGVVISTVENSTVKLGWSKVNKSAGDKFNREDGLEHAWERVQKGLDFDLENENSKIQIPDIVKKHLRRFIGRVAAYYRGCTLHIE